MTLVSNLLERAMHDLEQGWPEAAYDAIGQAWRLLDEHKELPEFIGNIVAQALAEHEARLQELERARARREDQTKFCTSNARSLRNAIKNVLAGYGTATPNAATVLDALRFVRHHPLPCVRTVQKHLEAIRGPGVGKRGPNRTIGKAEQA